MEANFSKLFIAAGGGLLGAILGGCLGGWRASAVVHPAAPDPDLLTQASPHTVATTVSLVIKGVFWGGLIGVLLTIAVLVYLSGERVRDDREVDGGE